MSFKKTLLIAVLFIVVVAVYWWDQKRIKGNEARQESESRLITPKRDALSEITIKDQGSTLKLQKQGDEWKLVQPIEARTDETALGALLTELDNAKKVTPFEAKGKLADFGLKEPKLTAEVKSASEKYEQKIEVGSETSAKDEVYAHLPKDGDKIFTLPVSFKTQLTKTPKDLRDKRLLPANLNEATSVTLTFDGKTFDLTRQGSDWKLRQPIQGPADAAKVGELLRNWNEAKAADFIDTKTLNLAAYGLDNPSLTGTVNVVQKGTTGTLTLLVGAKDPNNETQRYAMQRGGNYVMLVSEGEIGKLKPTLSDLRSKQLLTLKSADIGRVIFNVRGQALDLERDSAGKWHFRGDKATKVDNTVVAQKLSDLDNLQATQFIDGPTTAPTGLEKPTLRLTVASKDGKTTQTLLTGNKAENADFVYARLDGSDQVVGVNWQQPGKFFVTRDELLDKALFEFDENLAEKVIIRDGAKKITFTKDKSGAWTAQPEGSSKTYQVEGTQMTGLLYSLGSLNWTRRLDPKFPGDVNFIKTQNLENPSREITFLDADGKELARLGQGGEQGTYTYVRRGDKDYFAVDKGRYASVKSAIDAVMGATQENATPENATPEQK